MSLKNTLKTIAVGVLAASTLGGCGVFYTAPSVSDGVAGTDLDVRVVSMSHESVAAANLTPYVPARLPLGFQPEAMQKLAGRTIQAPRLAAIPAAPTQSSSRPGFIPDNLPPLEEPRAYRIGVADVLLLSVTNNATSIDQLPGLINAQSKRQGFVVQDDGAIAIPDAGRVRVAGMTMQDAEAEIFQSLVSAGIDPSFSLEIAEFNSQRVSVGGEVRTPALVPITLKPLFLHEAINSVGGLALDDPKVAKVQLFRQGRTFQIGAERFLTDPAMRQIVLRDGDSIYVGSSYREDRARNRFAEQLQIREQQQTQVQFALQAQQAAAQQQANALARLESERSLFKDRVELGAVKRDYAYLAGEVVVPSRYALPFERKAVVADVLFNERGLNINFADYGEIYVLRRSTNPEEAGSITAYHLNAENAANLVLAGMMEVHAGDVVFVAEQPITSWNRAFSQMLPNLFLTAANAFTGF